MNTPKLPLSPESPAYRLFIEELDKHLAFANDSFSAGPDGISAEIAKRLGASFHTIRGSAGFFGLTQIADLSKSLEEHFFGVAGGAPAELSKMRPLLDALAGLAAPLPRAGGA